MTANFVDLARAKRRESKLTQLFRNVMAALRRDDEKADKIQRQFDLLKQESFERVMRYQTMRIF